MFERIWEIWSENVAWLPIVIIIVFAGIAMLARVALLGVLTKIESKRNYNPEKLEKKMKQSQDEYGKFYFGSYYYIWEKKKLRILCAMYPEGHDIGKGKIITEIAEYTTHTSDGQKISAFRREFRVYYEKKQVQRSTVNNFSNYGSGNQYNDASQHEYVHQNIYNDLFSFVKTYNLEHEDEQAIKQFLQELQENRVTEKKKSNAIAVLSKYASIAGSVVSIIANISKLSN